jgi:hypothetical protein
VHIWYATQDGHRRSARDAKLKAEEDARMMKLYRKHVLKEPEQVDVVPITILPAPPKTNGAAKKSEEVGALWDRPSAHVR